MNVGIGDFAAAGGEPTERVDVVNGKTVQRSANRNSEHYCNTNGCGGVQWCLAHKPIPSGNGDWTMYASSPNHVFTAVGTPSQRVLMIVKWLALALLNGCKTELNGNRLHPTSSASKSSQTPMLLGVVVQERVVY